MLGRGGVSTQVSFPVLQVRKLRAREIEILEAPQRMAESGFKPGESLASFQSPLGEQVISTPRCSHQVQLTMEWS